MRLPVFLKLHLPQNLDKLGGMISMAEHSEYNTYTHDIIEGLERGTEDFFYGNGSGAETESGSINRCLVNTERVVL